MKLTRRRFTQALRGVLVAMTAPLSAVFPRVTRPDLHIPSAYFSNIISPDLFEDDAFSFESEIMMDARESMRHLDDQYIEDVDPMTRAHMGNSDNWTVRVYKRYQFGEPWRGFLEYHICRPAYVAPGARLKIERPSWWPA